VVSAHERAHVNSFYNNKWGTCSAREGADARGSFDSCSICLSRASSPLICPKGNVYCKACIYEFMMTQKQKQKVQMEAYEKQQTEEKVSGEDVEAKKALEEVEQFERTAEATGTGVVDRKRKSSETTPPVGYKAFKTDDGNVYLVDEQFVKTTGKASDKITAQEKEDRKKFLPCFWIPNLTPDNGVVKLPKPESGLRDPFGNKLKLKKLMPIKYTLTKEAEKNPKTASCLYMCPICQKELNNGTNLFLLRTTGDVLTKDCVELSLEEGSYKGQKLRGKDVIQFANTGTGFAAGGARKVESQSNPSFTYG